MGLSKSVREYVLKRSGHSCEMCGACDGDMDEYHPDRKVRLHVSSLLARRKGWSASPDNLRVLCSMCYRGVRQLSPENERLSSLLHLLQQEDEGSQLKVLEWLTEKQLERQQVYSGS